MNEVKNLVNYVGKGDYYPYNACCNKNIDLSKYPEYIPINKEILANFSKKLKSWEENYFDSETNIDNNTNYLDSNVLPLPNPLNNLEWVVFSVDTKYLVNPYLIVNFNKILSLDFRPEYFFGFNMLEYIESLSWVNADSELINSCHLGGRDKEIRNYYSNTVLNQKILANKFHWIDTYGDDYGLLMCTTPLSHQQAQFLSEYYFIYCNKREIDLKTAVKYGFYDSEIKFLENEEFAKRQKELRSKLHSKLEE